MEQCLLSSIRILIADDFKDWRDQVRILFQAQPQWQIVAEASDGSEAVHKAEELKPDLIVLDISLPNLNGIEAARRIRGVSPNSRIVFLSQNDDPDIVRAALTMAQGYVYKTDFRRDFRSAIQAVLQGQQFVSSSLKGCGYTDSTGQNARYRHEVQFYSDDPVFLDSVARFIATALKSGRAAIVFITESHRSGLRSRLKAQGLDIDAATQQKTYIQLDVAETLSTFMVNGMPDTTRFFQVAGGLIEQAARAARQKQHGVVVCGEGTAVLWADGKADAAIRVEQLWDQLGKSFGLDILCGYALSSFQGAEDEHVFRRICAGHSAVCSH